MNELNRKSATVIGVGALGSVIAAQLTKMGIGELRLIDRDIVEQSNLQRQTLFTERDAVEMRPKVTAAKDALSRMNSHTHFAIHAEDVNPQTIEQLVEHTDIMMDGTDNFETRFLINDISVKLNIPWVYGGAISARGMTTAIIPGHTPCLRCLFASPPLAHGETCDSVGVLGPLVHIVASYQVLSAVQLMNKSYGEPILRQVDIWYNDMDEMPLTDSQDPRCPCCMHKHFQYLTSLQDGPLLAKMCGRESIQMIPRRKHNVDFSFWEEKWSRSGRVAVKRSPFYVALAAEKYQLLLFQGGRVLIQGTDNEQTALRLYREWIGS